MVHVATATRMLCATWRAGNKKERSRIASLFFIALKIFPIIIFPSEIFHQKSSIRNLPSEIFHQKSSIRNLPSEIFHQKSSIRNLPSEIFHRKFSSAPTHPRSRWRHAIQAQEIVNLSPKDVSLNLLRLHLGQRLKLKSSWLATRGFRSAVLHLRCRVRELVPSL